MNNATNSSGALYAWKIADREAYEMEIHAKKPLKHFNPHGISIYERSLMVVNIRNGKSDCVEVFHLPINYPYRRIKHIKSVNSPLMTG